MTPTTGFAAEGLLRQLMPSAMSAIGAIVIIIVAVWVIRSFTNRVQVTEGASIEDFKGSMGWLNWGSKILILLILVGFVWNALSVTAINRMPRSDLDGSAVYDQMNNNITQSE